MDCFGNCSDEHISGARKSWLGTDRKLELGQALFQNDGNMHLYSQTVCDR